MTVSRSQVAQAAAVELCHVAGVNEPLDVADDRGAGAVHDADDLDALALDALDGDVLEGQVARGGDLDGLPVGGGADVDMEVGDGEHDWS